MTKIQQQFNFILNNQHLKTWAEKLSVLGKVKGETNSKVVRPEWTWLEEEVSSSKKTNKLRKVAKKSRNKVAVKAPRLITTLMVCDTRMPLTGAQKTSILVAKKATKVARNSLAILAKKLDKTVKEVSEMSLQNLLQVQEGGYNASLRNAATEVIETIRVAVEATKVARLA